MVAAPVDGDRDRCVIDVDGQDRTWVVFSSPTLAYEANGSTRYSAGFIGIESRDGFQIGYPVLKTLMAEHQHVMARRRQDLSRDTLLSHAAIREAVAELGEVEWRGDVLALTRGSRGDADSRTFIVPDHTDLYLAPHLQTLPGLRAVPVSSCDAIAGSLPGPAMIALPTWGYAHNQGDTRSWRYRMGLEARVSDAGELRIGERVMVKLVEAHTMIGLGSRDGLHLMWFGDDLVVSHASGSHVATVAPGRDGCFSTGWGRTWEDVVAGSCDHVIRER